MGSQISPRYRGLGGNFRKPARLRPSGSRGSGPRSRRPSWRAGRGARETGSLNRVCDRTWTLFCFLRRNEACQSGVDFPARQIVEPHQTLLEAWDLDRQGNLP